MCSSIADKKKAISPVLFISMLQYRERAAIRSGEALAGEQRKNGEGERLKYRDVDRKQQQIMIEMYVEKLNKIVTIFITNRCR